MPNDCVRIHQSIGHYPVFRLLEQRLVRELHDIPPALEFVVEQLQKFIGRAGRDIERKRGEAFPHIGRFQRYANFTVHHRDDFPRRAGRREHAVPVDVQKVLYACFLKGRNIGDQRMPLLGGDPQTLEPSRFDIRYAGRKLRENHRYLPGDRVRQRRAAALVRYFVEHETGFRLQPGIRHMWRAARTRRP